MILKQLSLNFIKLLASRKGPSKIRLHPYNSHVWFRGAYGTVMRTKQGGIPLRIRCSLMKNLFSQLPRLKQSNLDAKLKEIIQNTSTNTGLSIGQSQKLCNMLIKYHIAYYFSDLDKKWNNDNAWVKAVAPRAHIPIDKEVLKKAYLLHPKTFSGLINIKGYPKISKTKHSKTLYSWSKVPTYSQIQVLQDHFKQLAKSKGISPIELEMRELWRPP